MMPNRIWMAIIGLIGCIAGLVALPAFAPRGQEGAQPADLVITNGRIVTAEDDPPEVEALAIHGDRIAALGTAAAIERYIGPKTQVVDLQGQFAMPGFIEGHGHFTGIGQAQLSLNLMKANTWEEIVAMVERAVRDAKPGEWIYGRGWHQEKWKTPPSPAYEGMPTHHALSRVSPENPVLLTHASGHATFVNAKAMALSGITAATEPPPGGEIVRDDKGQPTGALRETASRLVKTGAGEPARSAGEEAARNQRILELASQEVLAKGVTSFQDAGSSFATVDLMKQMIDRDRIGVRLWVMLREGNDQLAKGLARYRVVDYASGRLTVRGIKRSIDGALGPHGAWLLEPYSDKPDSTGLNTTSVAEIEETARLALEHDYQLCVHAIGDRANRETLDLFERAAKKSGKSLRDLRWRVEHAQHLHPADIPRFGKLGVIASMQGIHCTSDAPWVIARLGEKRAQAGAYVWQDLMRSGALVTNGTDAPVEDVDPIASFHASVTRRLEDGSTFYPRQRMSRMEALKSYTIHAAYAAFEEGTKGSLSEGKYADLVVLSKDITKVPDEEILDAEVVYTIVGGRILHRRD